MSLDHVSNFEFEARKHLPAEVFRRISYGASDGITSRWNRQAWDELVLAPRVLRGIGDVSIEASVLGRSLSTPVLLAPVGLATLAVQEDADAAAAIAAEEAGSLFVLSNFSGCEMEEIAAAAPAASRWFQLYLTADRGWCDELIQRAKASGFSAIVLTVDAGQGGAAGRVPSTAAPMLGTTGGTFDHRISLSDLEWVRRQASVPVVVKGVLRPDDARRCVQAGASAIVVSNHGGNQLDTAVSTVDALASVVDAVGADIEVYVDGGIRRGRDVLKAAALGARAAFIGRPWVWGLAVGGSAGIGGVIERMNSELRRSMMFCGLDDLTHADRDLLWRHLQSAG